LISSRHQRAPPLKFHKYILTPPLKKSVKSVVCRARCRMCRWARTCRVTPTSLAGQLAHPTARPSSLQSTVNYLKSLSTSGDEYPQKPHEWLQNRTWDKCLCCEQSQMSDVSLGADLSSHADESCASRLRSLHRSPALARSLSLALSLSLSLSLSCARSLSLSLSLRRLLSTSKGS
jgi:hypothetical protein